MTENTTPPAEGGSNPPDQPNAPWWAGGETPPPAEAPTQDLSGQPAPMSPPAPGGGGQPPTQPPVAPQPAQPASGRNWTTIGLIAGAAAVGTILVAGAGFALGSRVSDDGFDGRGGHMGFRGDDDGDRNGDRNGDRDGDGDGDRGGQGFAPPGQQGQQGRPGGMGGMPGGMRPGALTGGPALHGEVIVPNSDGTFTTLVVQRGEVTAVSATSITVKSADGFTQEYAVTADSKIRVAGGGGAIGDVKVGDAVGVRATKSGSTVTVDNLVAGDAARMVGGGPGMGFTAGAATTTTATAPAA